MTGNIDDEILEENGLNLESTLVVLGFLLNIMKLQQRMFNCKSFYWYYYLILKETNVRIITGKLFEYLATQKPNTFIWV